MSTCFRIKLTATVCAVTLGMMTSASIANAAAFTDGSFESPALALGGSTSDPSTIGPWAVVIPLDSGSFHVFHQSNGSNGITVQDGVQSVGFGGNGTTGGQILQTFDTIIGHDYTISYYTAAQQVGSGAQSFSLLALNGVTTIASDINVAIPASATFVNHTLSFNALSGSSTISFTDTSNGGAAAGINWQLDNITVVDNNGPVTQQAPEPATLALLGTGLLGLAMARRRKAA